MKFHVLNCIYIFQIFLTFFPLDQPIRHDPNNKLTVRVTGNIAQFICPNPKIGRRFINRQIGLFSNGHLFLFHLFISSKEKFKRKQRAAAGWATPRDLLPELLALPATCDGITTARITAKATYHDQRVWVMATKPPQLVCTQHPSPPCPPLPMWDHGLVCLCGPPYTHRTRC